MDDPILRRWTIGHIFGRWPGEPVFSPHRPPYLDGLLPLMPEEPHSDLDELKAGKPIGQVELPLPGHSLNVLAIDPGAVFETGFPDIETLLGLHRFAWVPLLGEGLDPAWVGALWDAWRLRYGTPDQSWAWHPYTAAERAINILDFAACHGLPGDQDDTLQVLAAHGPAIAAGLEYFGDHHTSNHLANDGRGLHLLGLALGMEDCANVGACILVEEARRIFRPSGVLREGSSHYHVLLAHNYAQCARAARVHERPEADVLEAVAQKALSVLPAFRLPGGFPLVGDISPDCPPADLLARMEEGADSVDQDALAADGWLRADVGPWSGLWHASPDGWSHMPGHGHQDMGSFELHYADEALFIDPGRGAYGEEGEAARYRSAEVHNGITIDGADPYAPNKPYYNDTFRTAAGGAPPEGGRDGDTVWLRFEGYSRFKGLGAVLRRWTMEPKWLSIHDRVEGRGIHRLSRRLHTVLPAETFGGDVLLKGRDNTFRVSADGAVQCKEAVRWKAYGKGEPATCLEIVLDMALPHEMGLTVEVL